MRGAPRQSGRQTGGKPMGHNSKGKGKGRTNGRPKPAHSNTSKAPVKGKGKQRVQDTLDVFDAEDSDSGENDILRRRKLERVAVRDYEVEEVASEDDEEIESDDAFDVSDAERFGGYRFNGSSRGAAREEDSESEEEEEEDFEDEDDDNIVDLSEMLDASGSDEEEQEGVAGSSRTSGEARADSPPASASASLLGFKDLAVGGVGSGSSSESDDDEDDEDGELAAMGFYSGESAEEASDDEDDADADGDKLAKLDGFVSSISARATKRRFVEEAGDGLIEDENAIGSGLHTKGVTLGLGDLLGDLDDASGSASDDEGAGEKQAAREMRRLKDQVTTLERAAKKAGTGVVAAPLPKRLQDQVDRKVAYKKTKAAVSEWQPAVDANRVAEHLTFPLAAPGGPAPSMTSAMLVAGAEVTAKSDMEKQIDDILSASGMTDEQQR
ncbi:hypothetical protein LPJ73_005535, partial [Coemansia sp. RSA 2703]